MFTPLPPTFTPLRPTRSRRPGARTLLAAAIAAATALSAGACASSGFVPASEAPPVGGSGAAPVSAAPVAGLATARTSLGTVVTSDGFTVYRFDKDTTDPSATRCVDECARTWPPVLGDGVPPLKGVPSGLVGTVGRPDGTQQLTLNGWPLYRYAKDTAPGDTKGEGVEGSWKAIGADGKPASASAGGPIPSATPAATGSTGSATAGH